MEVTIELRKGGLEAYAALSEPIRDIQTAADAVFNALSRKGVNAPIPFSQIQEVLAGLVDSPDNAVSGFLVATGEPPQNGIDSKIEHYFPIHDTPISNKAHPFLAYAANVIYPGDPILSKTVATKGVKGRSLTGGSIMPIDGSNVSVIPGPGVKLDEDGVTYLSETYGIVIFHRGHLRVLPSIEISDDRMSATMVVFPDNRRSVDEVVDQIVSALGETGVIRTIDRKLLRKAVAQSRASLKPVGRITVARGTEPLNGNELDYKLLFDTVKKVGTELEGGRIDFREAEAVKNVATGERLAEVVHSTDPIPGVTVDDTPLPGSVVLATGPRPGENTTLSEDGAYIVATRPGMLSVKGSFFSVIDQYVVKGDVDYATGNIKATGSVLVRGSVKPGFKVEAARDVEVLNDLEEAFVVASGDVTVHGAITSESFVSGAKTLKARHIQNSSIELEGDVRVKLTVSNSTIFTKGKVVVSGDNGTIQGGEVNAAGGIETQTLGSPTSSTRVAVGVDMLVVTDLDKIEKERSNIATQLKSLRVSLGVSFLKDPRGALEAIPAPLRKPKLEMLAQLKNCLERERSLATRRQELLQRNKQLRDSRVIVHDKVHAGTIVRICNGTTELTEELHGVALYYDGPEGCVRWEKLEGSAPARL